MLSIIRRSKIAYSLYNFFHKKELEHNEPLFKKYGVRKKYYSSLLSKDFAHLRDEPITSKVRSNIIESAFFHELDNESQNSALSFNDNGFMVIRNYLSPAQADAVNKEIDQLIAEQKVKFNAKNKLMFAIHNSRLIRKH